MPKKIKDFDKEKMYSKIMPSVAIRPGKEEPKEEERRPEKPLPSVTPRLVLRNFIEDIVMGKLEYIMTMLCACGCERCKKEVMALALNELPTVYAVVEPEELDDTVKRLRASYEVKVSSALIKAVQELKQNPKH